MHVRVWLIHVSLVHGRMIHMRLVHGLMLLHHGWEGRAMGRLGESLAFNRTVHEYITVCNESHAIRNAFIFDVADVPLALVWPHDRH